MLSALSASLITILVLFIPAFYSKFINETENSLMFLNATKSIYYDLSNDKPLKVEVDSEVGRFPNRIRFTSRKLGCNCSNLTCGCCVGLKVNFINLERKSCANLTVVPEEFAVQYNVLMDDKVMFTQQLSGRNPPPVCIPLYFLPIINFCVRIYDLHIKNGTLNSCMDFETTISTWPIFILHFDCMRVGNGQIAWIKPGGSNASSLIKPSNVSIGNQTQITEVYDEVSFESDIQLMSNFTPNLNPLGNVDDDDGLHLPNIGTLKV